MDRIDDALPVTPLPDPALARLGDPIARFLADERLQRRLLRDCSYSPTDYADDPWAAWESGGCYTLAAALRPLLAPAGSLAGIYVRYGRADRLGEIEHIGIAIAGGFLDARGLRGIDTVIGEWAQVTASDPRLMRAAPIAPPEEQARYRGVLGSEPARIEALRRVIARDLAAPLRALRSAGAKASGPTRA